MTTPNEAREAIYALFAEQWALTDPAIRATPYCLENEAFDPPAGPWMRLSVRDGVRNQESLGPVGRRKFENDATIYLQFFEPPFLGTLAADTHMRAAVPIFEGRRIDGTTIRSFSATTRNLGIIEDGRWFAALLECPIVFDEQR